MNSKITQPNQTQNPMQISRYHTYIIANFYYIVPSTVGPHRHHGQQPSEHNAFQEPVCCLWDPFYRLEEKDPTHMNWDAVEVIQSAHKYPERCFQPDV